jgi:transposase
MLTVEDYGRIRRAHRDGMGIREMSRVFRHSRKTIRKILREEKSEAAKYSKRTNQAAPKLGPFHDRIVEILQQDDDAPRKQRHTAMRIFQRLRDEEGYAGGYDAVRRFVKKNRDTKRETFIPLDHQAGQRVEADFGEIAVDFPDGRRKVSVLILVWSYSNAPFAIALPTQRTEAILEGMTQAFEFFACVPREVWWDNPKTVASSILQGRERTINERYGALANHYAFDPLFCMPARGNEKPVVEIRVKTLERNWSTPVPQVNDMQELNAYLRQRCIQDLDRKSSRQSETIGQRFQQEKAIAATLPKRRFDPCIRQEVKVDKYQFARFDNVSYSAPRQCAFQIVTVKAYIDRIEMVYGHSTVATHSRSYHRGDQVLDPLHYLTTLSRRPAAIDHSNVYRNWTLPPVFTELRERLELRHGARAGVRQYVRVLQLLATHPVPRVTAAIEQLRGREGADADQIIRRVERSAARLSSSTTVNNQPNTLHEEGVSEEVLSVQVPVPGLSHFDQFLNSPTQGGNDDADKKPTTDREEAADSQISQGQRTDLGTFSESRCRPDANQVESSPVTSSDDESRVPEVRTRSSVVESNLRGLPTASHRAGSSGSCEQCAGSTNQTGVIPSPEGLGHLRLLGSAFGEQTESPRIGTL